MIFKRVSLEGDWEKLVSGKAMIVPVVLYAAQISSHLVGKQIVITEIYRSDAEQRQLCKDLKIPYYPTVHSYWRGVDLRVRIYEEEERLEIRDRLNSLFSYGKGKDVAVYHDVGAGAHIHIQAPALHGTWTS